jgi:hypothetical protein
VSERITDGNTAKVPGAGEKVGEGVEDVILRVQSAGAVEREG